MVRSSDSISARGLLTADFPLDRATAPAWLTIPASRIYKRIVRFRNARFDRAHGFRPPVPVISVGNLTVGGTGKTPFVIALTEFLQQKFPELSQKNAIAILSRGYGRLSSVLAVVEANSTWQMCGDEPLLIKQAVPDTAVVIHADRSLAARFAVKELGSRLLILDDGFQHRRLARDVDLVLMDSANPLGNGYCLPAGPLREPKESLARSSGIILAGFTGAAEDLALKFGKPILKVTTKLELPTELHINPRQRAFVLTSIARPQRFINMLKEQNLNIIEAHAFRDHHRFTRRALVKISELAEKSSAEIIVTTSKDRVRISDWNYPIPITAIGLKMRIENEQILLQMLEPVLGEWVK